MGTKIETRKENSLSTEVIQDIDNYLSGISGLSQPQIAQFKSLCRVLNLNPVKREIHAVGFYNKEEKKFNLSIIVGYEVYLKRAEMTGLLDGWEKGIRYDEEKNLIAWIKIYRNDWKHPFCHEVYYSEYVQTFYDKQQKTFIPTKIWRNKPKTMILKVVMAQGFRLCFPAEFIGMPYTQEEKQVEGNVHVINENTTVTETKKQKKEETKVKEKVETKGVKKEKPVEVEDASFSDPPSIETLEDPKEILDFIKSEFDPVKYSEFLIAKKWLTEKQTLKDLPVEKILAIKTNYKTLTRLFKAWDSK